MTGIPFKGDCLKWAGLGGLGGFISGSNDCTAAEVCCPSFLVSMGDCTGMSSSSFGFKGCQIPDEAPIYSYIVAQYNKIASNYSPIRTQAINFQKCIYQWARVLHEYTEIFVGF